MPDQSLIKFIPDGNLVNVKPLETNLEVSQGVFWPGPVRNSIRKDDMSIVRMNEHHRVNAQCYVANDIVVREWGVISGNVFRDDGMAPLLVSQALTTHQFFRSVQC